MIEGPESGAGRASLGRVHLWIPGTAGGPGGCVETRIAPLERLDDQGPGLRKLWGRFVRVRNAGVVHEPGREPGAVVAVPLGDAEQIGRASCRERVYVLV